MTRPPAPRAARPLVRLGPLATFAVLVSLFAAVGTAPSARAAEGADADTPLRAEEAFVPSLEAAGRDTLRLAFEIESGYYLYRDRIELVLVEPAVEDALGAPDFPPAIVVEDEFFGESATYRDALVAALPLAVPSATDRVTLDVTWQGCADIGLCYPPTTTRLDVALPKATSLLGGDTAPALSELFGGEASGEPELLAPEVAYVPVVMHAAPERIEVLWRIEPGYYLYRHKLDFTLEGGEGAVLGSPTLDRGTLLHDEFFGDVEVWRDEAMAVLPLDPAASLGSRGTLEIAWQGCADIGVCFPPKTTVLPIAFDDAPDAAANDATTGSANGAVTGEPLRSEQGRLATLLGSRGLWLNAATFFGLGLLLAFTPCVLPMIPILSSLIVGRGSGMSTARAFRLSLVYVLVMASTYAVLGVIVGLSGYNVQPFLQDPLVLSFIAALFVLLSLSMFGLYELQVPPALQRRLTGWSNRQRGGEVGGVAVMALISTLIVGPCVTAPLAGALIYIADTGDAAVGGVALFSLGLGMGAPLLLIGTSAGTLLPRAGAWMERVKEVFGIVLLAMAIYMLSRFLPASVTMALAGALALSSGVLFGATDTLTAESGGRQRFAKGLGLVVAVYGLALLVGALAGGGSYVTPLGALAGRDGGSAEEPGLAFRAVKGPDGLAAAVAEASASGRPLMLDFYADWCVSCKEMEAFTFTDPAVRAALEEAVVVQADVTANDAQDQALLAQFDLYGPPGIVFYDADGREVPEARVVGFVPAERFAEHVARVIGRRAI